MISAPTRDRKSLFASSMALIWMIAFAKLLFHIYFNNRCGTFAMSSITSLAAIIWPGDVPISNC